MPARLPQAHGAMSGHLSPAARRSPWASLGLNAIKTFSSRSTSCSRRFQISSARGGVWCADHAPRHDRRRRVGHLRRVEGAPCAQQVKSVGGSQIFPAVQVHVDYRRPRIARRRGKIGEGGAVSPQSRGTGPSEGRIPRRE